ncbi:MAG: hypothetical protein JXM79_08630 [Sedimentisphaerales bacterium]|nr:hypothetical protein [Sedimentisphaerales bacterium]
MRETAKDKEFHFQNWFEARLKETGLNYERGGRNSYPDFRLVTETDGYEIKGLAYPGREVTYDCNSQVPSGFYNGRTIYYVFGRYPKQPDGDRYPVLDLVICHGDFLNADHEYTHENKSIRGFGSYGDIMIRDRKMYVAPTPFGLLEGVVHQRTLIVQPDVKLGDKYIQVGEITRTETDRLLIAYNFDLRKNNISAKWVNNPTGGREHHFSAYRLKGDSEESVSLRIT